jgi:hypothetical protein
LAVLARGILPELLTPEGICFEIRQGRDVGFVIINVKRREDFVFL